MDATDAHEFAEQIREGKETNATASLTISILAVLVAIVTVYGHRTHTQAIITQSRAADTWNQYQARKIRQTNYTLNEDLLSELAPNSPAAQANSPNTNPTSPVGTKSS